MRRTAAGAPAASRRSARETVDGCTPARSARVWIVTARPARLGAMSASILRNRLHLLHSNRLLIVTDPPERRPFMPLDAVKESLDRVDPELGAFISLDADAARAQAREDRGGRLAGVPVAVKDLVDTAGIRTTYGSAIHADHVPRRDATVVARLREQGAIVLGKTNLNEYAYGVSAFNPHYGPTLTP